MVLALTSSMQTYTAPPPPRATALRPVSAGDGGAHTSKRPDIEAEALREDELQRLQPDGIHSQSRRTDTHAARSEPPAVDAAEEPSPTGETPSFPGGTAAFVAQLFAQEEPEEATLDPYGDASRAYERLREERHVGLVIDVRDPVDVTA